MRIRTFLSLAATAAGLLLSAPSYADTWVKSQSDHFVVYSNGSQAVAKLFTQQLEAYYQTLAELARRSDTDIGDSQPFEVFLLNDRRDMRAVWPSIPEEVGGFYTSCSEGAVAYSTFGYQDTVYRGHIAGPKGGYDFSVLFHEYAHHFTFQTTAMPLPSWYVEGFAEYFMTAHIAQDQITIGDISPERAVTLREGAWLDYADILRGKQGNGRSEDEFRFYAQSWLLTHYILSSSERSAMFADYIKAVDGGADPVTSFEASFHIKVADLAKTLRTYLETTAPTYMVKFSSLPDPHIAVTAMPKSADKLLMWQSALQACRRKDSGDGLVDDIRHEAGRFPDDPWAQRVLARAEIVRGVADAGGAIVSHQAETQPKDAEIQYLLGRYFMTKAKTDAGDAASADLKRARSAFGAAYRLNPLDAPNLYFLSLAYRDQPNYPDANAVNAAVQAANLAPSVQEYSLHAAQVLIRADRSDDAAVLLTPVASNPHAAARAARARTIIAAIGAHAPKDQLLEMMASLAAEKE